MISEDAGRRPLEIETDSVRVIVYTTHLKIVGILHIPCGARLSDYLNKTLGGIERDIFIPMTNVECYSTIDNSLKHSPEFIAIHKDHIQCVIPVRG